MRLWHQLLLSHLDRQRLLSQHRECAALRGAGWGRPHATVNYVFTHEPELLVAYHNLVMDEMENRGYHPNNIWRIPEYRGKTLSIVPGWADADMVDDQCAYAVSKGGIIYPEHDEAYLRECIELLKTKEAPINFEEMEKLI